MRRATAVGPAPHFSDPRTASDAVGNKMIGPTPHMSPPPVSLGERNADRLMSPSPNSLPMPPAIWGWLISGAMIRVIRFQSEFRVMGITGWKFVTF